MLIIIVLEAMYPDYTWDATKFVGTPKKYWHDKANQKQFFDDLAVKLSIFIEY
jgi:hypothetical protein